MREIKLVSYKRNKVKDGRFCEATIEVSIDTPHTEEQRIAVENARALWDAGKLGRVQTTLLMAGLDLHVSICGTTGRAIKRTVAKREALAYWASYFDECPEEIINMGKRFNKRFSTSKGAARFVLETDGDLHGLDVHGPSNGDPLLITESCGQIREELAEWFPELARFFSLHLSDMKAGAPDQERALADMPPAVYPVSHYDAACAWLRERDLLESKHEGWIFVTGDGFIPAEGYVYGSRWVHSVIPASALEALRDLSLLDEELAA